MTDLPTLESLDEAAKASGWLNWKAADAVCFIGTIKAIVAHARTLDTLHGRKPVDPIEAAIEAAWDETRASPTGRVAFRDACYRHFAGLTFPPSSE